jgi:CRISPR-associated protein Cas2
MSSSDRWYLLCYDIRDDRRYRLAVKIIKGYAERLQYSVFRCQLSAIARQKIGFELDKVLTNEDNVLFIELCPRCVERAGKANTSHDWPAEATSFRIIE